MEVTPIISTVSDSETNNNEMQVVEDYIQGAYIDLLSASDKLDGWRHWQTLYQLEVFDASGGSESWNIDFREKKIHVYKKNQGKITLYEGIAASDFVKLINGSTSWDYVGISGNYRTFNNIYRVGHTAY